MDQLTSVLARLNSSLAELKVADINNGLTNLLASMNQLVRSPDLTNSLDSLHRTLDEYRLFSVFRRTVTLSRSDHESLRTPTSIPVSVGSGVWFAIWLAHTVGASLSPSRPEVRWWQSLAARPRRYSAGGGREHARWPGRCWESQVPLRDYRSRSHPGSGTVRFRSSAGGFSYLSIISRKAKRTLGRDQRRRGDSSVTSRFRKNCAP